MATNEPQWQMPPQMPPQSAPYMRLVQDQNEATGSAADAQSADTSSMAIRFERREQRRFDMEAMAINIERWDGRRDSRLVFGKVVDLSAGGVRLRTRQTGVRADQQIRVRLNLPDNGGIFPFVETTDGQMKPTREWVGWLAVARVSQVGDEFDIAGRLVDMEEMDRGMLGLYLSTRAMAA